MIANNRVQTACRLLLGGVLVWSVSGQGEQPPGPHSSGDGPLLPDPARRLERLDRDDDGRVSRAEAPPRLRQLWTRVDRDQDGFLSLDELRSVPAPPGGPGRRPGARDTASAPPAAGAPAGDVSPVETPRLGLLRHIPAAFPGYTLLAPLGSTNTWLIDNDGRVVHAWSSRYRPGNAAYLLPNGHLLRTGNPGREAASPMSAGGEGGVVEEFDWDGRLVWEYRLCDEQRRLHHDIEPLPNGNVLMIVWERKTAGDAVARGRDPDTLPRGELWVDAVIEVAPTRPRGGRVVWRWSPWDHLVQDFDPAKPNHGRPADHPERVDVNFPRGRAGEPGADWLHMNSVAYHAARDEIALSVHGFSEVWIIRHGGEGGLLWRWGNPAAYGMGGESEQQLFGQHDAHWIPADRPGGGRLLVFDNGARRPGGRYSAVKELALPALAGGGYARETGHPFGPVAPAWSYTSDPPEAFFAQNISGAERLPNGNTLICSGPNGRIFEVTPAGRVVWEYVNPVVGRGSDGPGGGPPGGPGGRRSGPAGTGPGFGPAPDFGPPPGGRRGIGGRDAGGDGRRPGAGGPGRLGGPRNGPPGGQPRNPVFRALRYPTDYPAFAGRDLTPGPALADWVASSRLQDGPAASGLPPGGRRLRGSRSLRRPAADAIRLYVNAASAASAPDGRSWNSAYRHLNAALEVASRGGVSEIWVAEGTYRPTDTTDRQASFRLVSGVAVYGGFGGDETSLGGRDWEAHRTILSGDIGQPGVLEDNTQHVVVGADEAVLDGFVIQDGYALGSGPGGRSGARPGLRPAGGPGRGSGAGPGLAPRGGRDGRGGARRGGGGPGGAIHTTPQAVLSGSPPGAGAGLLNYRAAPVVRHCVFRNHHAGKGGAVYNMTARSFPPGRGPVGPAPVFEDCTFLDNHARGRGGAVSNDLGTSPTFRRCRFLNNVCDRKGGGMYNDFGCSPLLVQCLFVGNRAHQAGALGNDGGSSPYLLNCTFTRNVAGDAGAAIYQGTGPANNPVLKHCILWDNRCDNGPAEVYNWHDCSPQISDTCIRGGWPGEGNLDADPGFRDPEAGDFTPAADSPCPRAGWTQLAEAEPAAWPPPRQRRQPGGKPAATPDRTLPSQAVVRVRPDASSPRPDGRSWATAFGDLQAAIDHAWRCGGEVWVAAGTYRPTTSTDRSRSFRLRPGVAVYGGFSGRETRRDQRDWQAHRVVLSGDIGRRGDALDNAYHVLVGSDEARLDGFVVTGGRADGQGYDAKGGGLINYHRAPQGAPRDPSIGWSPVLVHCRFVSNHAREGGAVYDYDRSRPVYDDCVFEANTADFGGAVLQRVGVQGRFVRCRFANNRATWRAGGLYLDYGSRARLEDTAFVGNRSGRHGGAVYACSRASQLENTTGDFNRCVFQGNQADGRGGAVADDDNSLLSFRDCRFERNRARAGGGAVSVDRGAQVTLDGASFTENRSDEGAPDVDPEAVRRAGRQ